MKAKAMWMSEEYRALRELEQKKLKEAEELRRLRDFHMIECCKYLEECAKQLKEFTKVLINQEVKK